MSDLIKREDATKAVYELSDKLSDEMLFVDAVIDTLENLPSAEPDNQLHLCGFCKYGYPECPAEMSDVIFGNGIGHDNVCVCAKFEIKPERKKGEWIHDGSQWANRWICSECEYKWFHSKEEAHFCPNCGAEMTKGE